MADHGFTDREAGQILTRMDHQDETLAKILEQATKTNGRVTSLERWRSWTTGVTVTVIVVVLPFVVPHLRVG